MAHPQISSHNLSVHFDTRPQAIDNWLNALPRGSVGKTSELIFHALQDLAGQELKAMDRFRVLEAIRESVHYATSNLNKHVQGKSYPLQDKVMRIASACQSIHNYMADGYITVFHDLQKQNSLLIDNRMLTTTIYRAIVYIQQSLLLNYEIYSAFHHEDWERLHELYQYAELHRLIKNKVHEPLLHSKRNSSIREEYIRTLLLYLAEPYHLRPGEINQIHHHLEDWSGLCDLQKISSVAVLTNTHLPTIELNSDQPPQQNSGESLKNNGNEHLRILDRAKLITRLKKEHKQQVKNQAAVTSELNRNNISISLLRRLIESWEHTRQRRFPRQTVNARVNVTIGLHHAHMQLMYEQHLKKNKHNRNALSGFQPPQFETIEIKSVENEHSDVWSTVYSWANSVDPKPENNLQKTQSDNTPKSIVDYRVQQDNWKLVNESAEGLGLVCTDTPVSRVQVGEVISVQRNNSAERSVGLVRWMKARAENGIELGVMLLAPTATPVGLIAEDPAKGDYVIDRGLLLPLMQILNRPESLLTFSRQYRIGDILAINQPGKENTWIKLVKLIADNGSISQYLFTRIQHTDKPLQDEEISKKHDQFRDIWLSI